MYNANRKSRLVTASPVYYGWIILVVGSLGGVMTSPGQTYAFSAFLDHFIEDLELSRSLVSTLYTVGTLTASFVLPFVGRQFDRRGARFMIALVSLLLGLACIYMLSAVYNENRAVQFSVNSFDYIARSFTDSKASADAVGHICSQLSTDNP